MNAPAAEFNLRRQTEAARTLLATLRADGVGDDAQLMADAVEGETGLYEALTEALSAIDESDVIRIGARAVAKIYEDRAAAAESRAERIRAMIERALIETGIDEPLRLAGATISLTKRPRQVVITDEAQIPSRFFVEQPRLAPKLDKKALAAALADPLPDAKPIPGAVLDNGALSLLVRRK